MLSRHRNQLNDIMDTYNKFLMSDSPSQTSMNFIPFSHKKSTSTQFHSKTPS